MATKATSSSSSSSAKSVTPDEVLEFTAPTESTVLWLLLCLFWSAVFLTVFVFTTHASLCPRHLPPPAAFLCPLSANVYNLAFLSFVMKDYETKRVIFEIGGADAVPDLDFSALGSDFDTDSLRKIRYDFSVDVLRMPTLSTTYGRSATLLLLWLPLVRSCAHSTHNSSPTACWHQAGVLQWSHTARRVPHGGAPLLS